MMSVRFLKKSSSLIFSLISKKVDTTFPAEVWDKNALIFASYHFEVVELCVLSVYLIQFKKSGVDVAHSKQSFELLKELSNY